MRCKNIVSASSGDSEDWEECKQIALERLAARGEIQPDSRPDLKHVTFPVAGSNPLMNERLGRNFGRWVAGFLKRKNEKGI